MPIMSMVEILTCGNFADFFGNFVIIDTQLGFVARGLLFFVALVLTFHLQFCWHVHPTFLCFCHVLCWLTFWCDVVVLDWWFLVLFPWLFSSSLIAFAVQGASFLYLLCMSVFGAAAAIFLPGLLLFCCLLHVLWFFTQFFLLVLFFCVLFCCLLTFMLCFWLSSLCFPVFLWCVVPFGYKEWR